MIMIILLQYYINMIITWYSTSLYMSMLSVDEIGPRKHTVYAWKANSLRVLNRACKGGTYIHTVYIHTWVNMTDSLTHEIN